MTNFNQFSGPQAAFQPGFAGTDAQRVRQQNAQSQSSQNQFGGTGYQQSLGNNIGQFSGPQAVFQQGFAGTNAQEVRQQNAQSSQNQFGGSGYQQIGQQFQQTGGGFSQFSGPQAVFQPGFAGTDAQQVRQDIAQTSQNQLGRSGYQGTGGRSAGQFSGPQAVFQPGFAGTNAQEVRQQNAQSSQNQFGGGGFQQSQGYQQSLGGNIGQFSGPQAIFQPGFAGTDAQQVRQDIAQTQQNQFGASGSQQMGQQFQQTGGGFSQFSGPQAVFQPGFAGTDAQQVRQNNAQSSWF